MYQHRIASGIILSLACASAFAGDTVIRYSMLEVHEPKVVSNLSAAKVAAAKERYMSLGLDDSVIQKNIANMYREVEFQRNGFTREGTYRVFWLEDIVVSARVWDKSPSPGRIMEILGPTIYGRFDGAQKMGNGYIRMQSGGSVGGNEMPFHWLGYTVGHEFSRSLVAGMPWKDALAGTGVDTKSKHAEFTRGTSRFVVDFDENGEPKRMDWLIGMKDSDTTLTIDEWTTVAGKRVAKTFTMKRHAAKITQKFDMEMSSSDPAIVAEEWRPVAPIQAITLDARSEKDRTFAFGGSIQAVKDLDRQTHQQDMMLLFGLGSVTLVGLGFGVYAFRKGTQPRRTEAKPA